MRTPFVLTMAGAMILVASPAASASWGATAGGAATARAGAVPAVGAPVVETHGSSVTVDWRESPIPVRGYRLSRINAATGATVTVERGCSGVLTDTSCTEGGVPAGRWAYAVVALVGNDWRSVPGPATPVTVGKPDAVTAPSISPTSPSPTVPVPTSSAPTSPAPTSPAPTAPPSSRPVPSSKPSHPVPSSKPTDPVPSSKPTGPAPTVSSAPSAEPTKAPALSTPAGE
uniref:hypothetical protein n=1 Tax=Paractinoplanes polyasparticus TaxID=2856853 RepID=UPI001C85049C|nr:hypothetical protein [Actinoplanes polyasparticus]